MRVTNKIKRIVQDYFFNTWGIPQVYDEQISKRTIKRYLPDNPVMIDCGAYDGEDSKALIKTIGGTIHSFEAVPEIYNRLVNNTKNFPNIRTYNLALSSATGSQTLYISTGKSDASSSLLPPKEHLVDHPFTKFEKKLDVQAVSLDDWANDNQITHVDFLWLDMQGFEMDMLMASKIIFSSVKAIHTEVSLKETYDGVKQYKEFKAWLISKGFNVEIEAIPRGWDMGNVFFIRK